MIPLLITMDLEVAYDYDLIEQKLILNSICEDFGKMELPITVFATSESVNLFPEQIKELRNAGNEIGCHGLNHSKTENYKKLTEEQINFNIITAGKNIEEKISEKPVCFRGPGMSTSASTQKILIENGYITDFSVCSQRIDFILSKGGDIRWLFAPRLPYNPSDKNPFTKGDIPLWVIPLSCIGIPFISGILYTFGLKFMKLFFRCLLKESLKTKKPIVYLFHSYEVTKYVGSRKINNEISDVKRNKQKILHKFYRRNKSNRYKMNLELIKYMLSFNDVAPLTGKEYCKQLKGI